MKSSHWRCFILVSWWLITFAWAYEGGGEAGDYDVDKYQPEKGNPLCDTEAFHNGVPCRMDDHEDEGLGNDEDFELESSVNEELGGGQMPSGSSSIDDDEKKKPEYGDRGPPDGTRPPGGIYRRNNSIRFNVYLALPPKTFSVAYILKIVVTLYLNTMVPEYSFNLPEDEAGEPYTKSSAVEDFISEARDIIDKFIKPEASDIIVENTLISVDPSRFELEGHTRWWWRYRFRYDCFYPGNHEPVFDMNLLNKVRRRAISALREGVETLQEGLLDELGPEYSSIKVQLDPPNETEVLLPTQPPVPDVPVSFSEHPAPMPPSVGDTPVPAPAVAYVTPVPAPGGTVPTDVPSTNATAPPSEAPSTPEDSAALVPDTDPEPTLDTSEWDWRRYVGLGILLGTFSSTCCLVQLAGWRRRRRAKKENWGNLTTEKGVEDLLRTGWKVRGNKLEVFDKEKAGYADDDSMLIGGFEQREHVAVVGTEITVAGRTHPSSSTSPESML